MSELDMMAERERSTIRYERVHVEDKPSYLFTKRAMDIVGSLFGLIIFSWLFVIVSILIKIEDPKGPVIFKQERVGKNGKTFYMYKFRSMVSNAEQLLDTLLEHNEVSGAMFKMKEDPRITRIGKIIRRTSIDELPQLWNVLKGDMSLVGPRPPLEREVEKYTNYDKQRLLVKPGCTGLWQVSGRNKVGFKEMVELDLKYIRTRSIWNDVTIILKTVKVMIKPNSAY
ncbi:multidrug MFS transporter [Siminovitchia terrae]|nr:multidrug MFS transporter [Siminovitchia terrae]